MPHDVNGGATLDMKKRQSERGDLAYCRLPLTAIGTPRFPLKQHAKFATLLDSRNRKVD